MKRKLSKLLTTITISAVLLFLAGCRTKIVIPDYESVKEQYFYAMKIKLNTTIALDKKRREHQLRRIEAAFYKVIEEFPEDTRYTPAAYINLGDAYLKFHHPHKAIKIFSEAIEKYPDQEDIQLFGHYGLGVAYDSIGEFESAKKEYKFCIEKFGDTQKEEFKKIVEICRRRYDRIREKY